MESAKNWVPENLKWAPITFVPITEHQSFPPLF
jgi:hypothetical protein